MCEGAGSIHQQRATGGATDFLVLILPKNPQATKQRAGGLKPPMGRAGHPARLVNLPTKRKKEQKKREGGLFEDFGVWTLYLTGGAQGRRRTKEGDPAGLTAPAFLGPGHRRAGDPGRGTSPERKRRGSPETKLRKLHRGGNTELRKAQEVFGKGGRNFPHGGPRPEIGGGAAPPARSIFPPQSGPFSRRDFRSAALFFF